MIFFKPAFKKFCISRILIMLGTITLSGSAFAEKPAFNGRTNVIFDTDVCLDVDDIMALAIVHALQDRREAKLLAVTIGLDHKWCAPYVEAINRFYGYPDVPIGTVRNGLSLRAAEENIGKGLGTSVHARARDEFVRRLLDRRNPDGSPTYPHRLEHGSQAPEAIGVLRRTLAAQADDSVVMVQVGNSANFAALLDSGPDAVSDFNGFDLVKQKVRFLSVMASTFQDIEQGAWVLPKGTGINVFDDVSSAHKLFEKWPTPIIVSGSEIGLTIRFPRISIERDFSFVSHHPIAESYEDFCASMVALNRLTCLHDMHTADPTATLYALRPDRRYFSLSKPGKITVLPDGDTRFDDVPGGKHFYLIANDEQKARVEEAVMMLVSQPPVALKH